MAAEAACEMGGEAMIEEALDYLEQVRARARGTNTNVLPKVTTTNQLELCKAIHHERHVELALEFDRFYDLVRWQEVRRTVLRPCSATRATPPRTNTCRCLRSRSTPRTACWYRIPIMLIKTSQIP